MAKELTIESIWAKQETVKDKVTTVMFIMALNGYDIAVPMEQFTKDLDDLVEDLRHDWWGCVESRGAEGQAEVQRRLEAIGYRKV